MRSTQPRLYTWAIGSVATQTIRKFRLVGARMQRLIVGRVRRWLLEVPTGVRLSARNLWVAVSSAYGHQGMVGMAARRLTDSEHSRVGSR